MTEISQGKLLIVDDNQHNLELMKTALKQENIDIQTAESGAAALEKLVDNEFALIIMDVDMPVLTGFDTVEIIKESQLSKSTPIIFISSHCKAGSDIETGFKIGACDYILRPVDMVLFKNKVKIFLKLYQTEQALQKANFLLADKAARLDSQLTEQLKINNALKFSEHVFENSVNGIIVVDKNLQFVRVNQAFSKITGYSLSELVGKTPKILSSGIQDQRFYEEMWHTLQEKEAWQGELWNRRKNNELYAEMLSINAVKDEQGVVSHYIGIVSDITERKRANEKAEYLANYDYLTGLPNRLNLISTLEKYIADDEITTLAVLFLDLDKFKPVNDRYGHQTGDELLVAVAKRLRGCVRDTDLVARLGGDEFIIVLKKPNTSSKASEKVAKKIISAVSSPFNISDKKITINTSIGIALYPEQGKDADDLITLADDAMYKSKSEGAGCFHFCTEI